MAVQNKKEAFGLDISELSLKIANLKKTGDNLSLSSFGYLDIPAGVIGDSKVQEPERLSFLIKQALKSIQGQKIKTKLAVVSLPEEKSFLDVFRLPNLPKEELEQAVRFEAENHIPMLLEDVYFDFELLPKIKEKSDYQEVLVSASPKEVIDSYSIALKMAGLQPKAMEIEGLAIVRAVVKKDLICNPLLVIDFGENRTSFMLVVNQSLRFTSTIPIAAKMLTKSIADKMKIPSKQAEELKQTDGLLGKEAVSKAMLPLLNDFVEQIKSHLKYYNSHAPQEQIELSAGSLEKIILCGGGANLAGLSHFLSSALALKVELANPWTNILKEPIREVPILPYEKSLSYATALGLALRGIYGD